MGQKLKNSNCETELDRNSDHEMSFMTFLVYFFYFYLLCYGDIIITLCNLIMATCMNLNFIIFGFFLNVFICQF